MLDYRTVVMYGWKISGRETVSNFIKELEAYDEDYYDNMERVIVEDTMCGKYFYFGAKLVYQDAVEEHEVIITDELIKEKMMLWDRYLTEHPKFKDILNYVVPGGIDLNKPQMYVFQHIW